MKTILFKLRLMLLVLPALLSVGLSQFSVNAQTPPNPITSDELVRMVRQLPTRPALRDQIISEIRRRGIGFPLTAGLRSVVATKSGNDALLRRTLEEAERRRLNPSAEAVPSEADGRDLLEKARAATRAAAEAMPDFAVKQQIIRSAARGLTKNWSVQDRLTLAVSYRESSGEQYRVLAVNGQPMPQETSEGASYRQLGGATTTGEYVGALIALFSNESQTTFQLVDTDLLRGRRALVYEFQTLKKNSRATITYDDRLTITAGTRGRIWIDRETFRVLRMETFYTEIPADFPVTALNKVIDYDWVTISERQYLLPTRAVVEATQVEVAQTFQRRNDIRFRNYQKYGTEIKIIEEDIFEEEEPPKEQKPKP
jgi:hypothetical protein